MAVADIVLPSAKLLISNDFYIESRSFRNKLNSIGPKMDL